jgi:hypothetical protein
MDKNLNIAKEDQRYTTVKQVASDPSFCFTVPMLRYYILHARRNGFESAIFRIGRKLLIRRDLLIHWLENQGKRRCQ